MTKVTGILRTPDESNDRGAKDSALRALVARRTPVSAAAASEIRRLVTEGADPNCLERAATVSAAVVLLRLGARFDAFLEGVRRKEVLVGSSFLASVLEELREDAGVCDADAFANALKNLAAAQRAGGTDVSTLEKALAARSERTPAVSGTPYGTYWNEPAKKISTENRSDELIRFLRGKGDVEDAFLRGKIPGLLFLVEVCERLFDDPGNSDLEKVLSFCRGKLVEQFSDGAPFESTGGVPLLRMMENISGKLDEATRRKSAKNVGRSVSAVGNARASFVLESSARSERMNGRISSEPDCAFVGMR